MSCAIPAAPTMVSKAPSTRQQILDLWFEVFISIFVIWQFFESFALTLTKFYYPSLYPFAFIFRYLILLLAVAPRFPRLRIAYSWKVVVFCGLLVYGGAISVVSHQSVERSATSIRDLSFFFVIFFMMYAVRLSNRERVLRHILGIIVVMSVINIIYASYVVLTNDGTPNSFYFYEYLVSIDRWAAFNFFRNDKVRAFGFFASPVIYSNLLIIPTAYILAKLLTRPNLGKLLLLTVMVVGMAETLTRNPPFSVVVAFLIWIAWRITKRFSVILFAQLMFLFASFYGLSFLYQVNLLEPSSAGRVVQAKQYLPTIVADWQGFGFGSFGAQFLTFSDLSFLTIFLTFGLVGGILYYWFAFDLLRRVCAEYLLRLRQRQVSPRKKEHFITVFLIVNAFIVTSINTNIFDSIVLPLLAVVLGLYVERIPVLQKES